jgi:MoaA/NifB/PqqE/SkfB family radical SAM enzyme
MGYDHGTGMRRVDQDWTGRAVVVSMRNAWRRAEWFTRGVSAPQVANGVVAAAGFGLRRPHLRSWPVLVKVDISPMCNLHCTYCVHATADVDHTGILAQQSFSSRQRMAVANYERLLAQIRGRSAAVALYYVGDPLVHPELSELCRLTADAGLNSHISSNFSFHLGDDRLSDLVTSGLSHLTVCVDSMQQERYQRTRVGGDIALVLSNLERVLAIRAEAGRRRPSVEVQFIKYQHNADEVEAAAAWCAARGVDQFTEYWGNLHNYADLPTTGPGATPLEAQLFPRCAWPWFALQVKYDGDVIPCCYHRVGEQYRAGGDARPLGNVFDDGLFRVWNSPAYRQLRRLATDPAAGSADLGGSFCEACPVLFASGTPSPVLTADLHHWESVYFRTEAGAVVRR